MKQELPKSAIFGAIAVVVVIVGFVLYKANTGQATAGNLDTAKEMQLKRAEAMKAAGKGPGSMAGYSSNPNGSAPSSSQMQMQMRMQNGGGYGGGYGNSQHR